MVLESDRDWRSRSWLCVFELTVQVVQLQHEEGWLKLVQVVLGRQVYWQVELVLYLYNVVQIRQVLSPVLWVLKEQFRSRFDFVVGDVQVEDEEHRQPRLEEVEEVLVLLRNLEVRVEELDD